MQFPLKAVIFDMDGVLIDSEPLWRTAMIKGFTGAGIPFTEADCRKTTGRRINEVIDFWLNHYQLTHIDAKVLEQTIMDYLFELIASEGKAISGVPELLAFCRDKKLKTGLATSSSNDLMRRVLKKLNIADALDAVVSAEHMTYGKPHPEVFLACAHALQVKPQECMVIEDSLNGVIAAKAALMCVIAVPDEEHRSLQTFALADHNLQDMRAVLALFKTLMPEERTLQ